MHDWNDAEKQRYLEEIQSISPNEKQEYYLLPPLGEDEKQGEEKEKR